MLTILTWRVALMEAGRDFGQSVSAGGGGGWKKGPESLRCLLLLQVSGSYFLADARLQQTVGWNRAVPEQPVQAGLHWEHHTLKSRNEEDRLVPVYFIYFLSWGLFVNKVMNVVGLCLIGLLGIIPLGHTPPLNTLEECFWPELKKV